MLLIVCLLFPNKVPLLFQIKCLLFKLWVQEIVLLINIYLLALSLTLWLPVLPQFLVSAVRFYCVSENQQETRTAKEPENFVWLVDSKEELGKERAFVATETLCLESFVEE